MPPWHTTMLMWICEVIPRLTVTRLWLSGEAPRTAGHPRQRGRCTQPLRMECNHQGLHPRSTAAQPRARLASQ